MAALRGSERCVEYILQAHPESLNVLDKHQVKELILMFLSLRFLGYVVILRPAGALDAGQRSCMDLRTVLGHCATLI